MAAKMTDSERDYLDQRFSKIEALLTDMRVEIALAQRDAKNCREASDAQFHAARSRVAKLESNQRWVVLGLLTAFGAALYEWLIPHKAG